MERSTAIIGDIGGHLDELVGALVSLGWDRGTCALPSGLCVVQVGDLVHRGPNSAEVVDLVDRIIKTNPGQWVQLMGNHEAQYVIEESFLWEETLPVRAVETLRTWWAEGRMSLAHAVDGERGLLVTHAGLTAGCWRSLGSPTNALDAAGRINSFSKDPSHAIYARGRMLTGRRDTSAGVLWAEAGEELLLGWLAASTPAPFDQVHGHSSAYNWSSGRFGSNLTRGHLEGRITLDRARRHATTIVNGSRVIGIDPGHRREAATRWAPLLLGHKNIAG